LEFLAVLNRAGSKKGFRFDGADCWSEREACYPIRDDNMAEE
jgi:hypothetical protein